MADYYEIDFFPVHARDSGDAISIRYQVGDQWEVHVIDGGFESTAEGFEKHIRDNYGTGIINRVIVTHPDQDHAEGLSASSTAFNGDVEFTFSGGAFGRAVAVLRASSASFNASRI